MYLCGRTNNAHNFLNIMCIYLPIIHFLGFAFGGVVNGRKYLLTIDFRLSTVNKYLSMLKQCLRFGQLCWKRPMQSKFNWFN